MGGPWPLKAKRASAPLLQERCSHLRQFCVVKVNYFTPPALPQKKKKKKKVERGKLKNETKKISLEKTNNNLIKICLKKINAFDFYLFTKNFLLFLSAFLQIIQLLTF